MQDLDGPAASDLGVTDHAVPNAVTVWWADAREWAAGEPSVLYLLSASELDRWRRLRSSEHRSTYACAHILVRLLASHMLRIDPGALDLRNDARGKPLLGDAEVPSISISHSTPMAAAAFCSSTLVGVDVEARRPPRRLDTVALRVMSGAEARAWHADAAPRLDAFYDMWTVKEALLKASGVGIAGGMSGLDVGLPPRACGRPTSAPDCMGSASQWAYQALDLLPGWSAAVAVRATTHPTVTVKRVVPSTLDAAMDGN